jgi:predicted small integral membrane protein
MAIMTPRVPQFIAIILTALALVPAGAHVLELPNKIGLGRDDYMVVQQIYRGWAFAGIILIGALISNGFVAVLMRHRKAPAMCAAAAALLIGTGLAIFFTWTFPANQATANWTVAPADWSVLRRQWESAHAANAAATFLALCCAVLAALIPAR